MLNRFCPFFLASVFFSVQAFAYDSEFKVKNESSKTLFVAFALEYSSGIDWEHYSDARASGFYKITPGETKSIYKNRDGGFNYTFLWFKKEGELPWTGSPSKNKLNLQGKGLGGKCEYRRANNEAYWLCDVRGPGVSGSSHIRVHGSLDDELTKGKQFDFFEVKLTNDRTGGTITIK
jgi:hypothetical protein